MTPDTIPELIMWLAAVGAGCLLIGALVIGPVVYRWRLHRLFRRISDAETALAESGHVPLPELSELLAQAFDDRRQL